MKQYDIGAVWEINAWSSPATAYPRQTVGEASIAWVKYTPGFYHAYNTRPIGESQRVKYFEVKRAIRVTALRIRRKTWMVDDPPHWWAITEDATSLHGHVLCAGLGLGLIVHALDAVRDVELITVVERNADVIKLVQPLLPQHKLQVIQGDWWNAPFYLPRQPESIFFDLFVGKGEALLAKAVDALQRCRKMFPSTEQIRMFGFQQSVVESMADATESGPRRRD